MNFSYPTDFQINNEDVNHLKGSSNITGFFPVGRFNTWHGGIHIEGKKPIKAMADGKIIAYRVPEKYHKYECKYNNGSAIFSTGFVVIRHEYISPIKRKFVFFSLYHHLIPYEEMSGNYVPEIFSKKSFKVSTKAKDKGEAQGINIRSSKKYSNKITVKFGGTVTIDNNLTAKEKLKSHWVNQKAVKYQKVKYTSPNGTIYDDYFICTSPRTINNIKVERVKSIPGGKLEIVTKEDTGWDGDVGLRERKKPGSKGEVIRIIPQEKKLEVDETDNGGVNGWGRLKNTDGSKGGYVYIKELDTEKSCSLKKNDLNKINIVDIDINAGTIIGYCGKYGAIKGGHYNLAHVEVFSKDVKKFLENSEQINNKKDGDKSKFYYSIPHKTTLKNGFSYSLMKNSRVKVLETKGDYSKIEILDIEKTVPNKSTHLGKYSSTGRNYTFTAEHSTQLANCNSIFNNMLKTGDILKLTNTDSEITVKNNKKPKDLTRKVRYTYNLASSKFWIKNSSIAAQDKENSSTNNGIRYLGNAVNFLYIECPSDVKEMVTDVKLIVNLRSHKTYIDNNDNKWYYITHKDFNSKGQQQTYKGIIGNINDSSCFSAFDWNKFGFIPWDDHKYDEYLYDHKTSQLLKAISNITYEYVDKNNKTQTQQIDRDQDGILEPHELQRAFGQAHIANALSKLVVKHTSEWAYEDDKRDNLLSLIEEKYKEGIKNEKDPERKNELKAAAEEMLDAIKEKMKMLCFWSHLNGIQIKETIVKPDNTKSIRTSTIKNLPSQVWHFNPIAFVEHMRKLEDKLIFPCKKIPLNHPDNYKTGAYASYDYTKHEKNCACFGYYRTTNGVITRLHAARDLYFELNEPIYAIADGVVKEIHGFYQDTWRVEIEHNYEIIPGHKIIVRYGEVSKNNIKVHEGQIVKKGQQIAEIGLLVPYVIQPWPDKRGMLHFELYTGVASGKLNQATPYDKMIKATSDNYPGYTFNRRKDLRDPLELLNQMLENSKNIGYIN